MSTNMDLEAGSPLVLLSTVLAGVRFLTRVNEHVSLKISFGREGFITIFMRAFIGPLAKVESQVGIQVASFFELMHAASKWAK